MKRFRTFYGGADADLLDRVFAIEEQIDAAARPDTMAYLAMCLAAKEAVLKTISGLEQGIALSDIVISRATSRRPGVRLDGDTRAVAIRHGIHDFSISTAYAGEVASALVIACG